MDKIVYALCALTSAACAILLLRGYMKSRVRLLFWSTLCFACLAASNILVFVDLVVFPDIELIPGLNLYLVRNAITLVGVSVLLAGMIAETV